MARNVKSATPADVRAFGTENGLPVGGTRGRLPNATIDAYNKANKGKSVYSGKPERTVTVKGFVVSEKGRKTPVTRTIPMSEARAVADGTRGRFSQATLLTAAGLS